METYEQRTFPSLEAELPCFPLAYRVSRRPLPGSDEARKMIVGSGRQCSMLLDASSPLGAFSKILLESYLWTNSAEFCYVWQILDTRFGCSAFQLTASEQSIVDDECSLWPTATSNPHEGNAEKTDGGINLATAAKLWPTPHAADGTGGGRGSEAVRGTGGGCSNLRDVVKLDSSSGSLNPHFVEQLMGFPIDHTALKHSEMPSSRSKRTRSSKRSRKRK